MTANPLWTFYGIAIGTLLGGCGGAEEPTSRRQLVMCRTEWVGEMPAASGLSLRACLSETICSDIIAGERYGDLYDPELNPNCPSENGCGNFVGGFVPTPSLGSSELVEFRSHWWDVVDGQSSVGGDSLALVFELWYPAWVSQMLDERDRATLSVQADSGEMLVDATSLEPYATVTVRPSDSSAASVTCRGAWLNLDGSLRSDPYPSY
jgi:hypothetical protein